MRIHLPHEIRLEVVVRDLRLREVQDGAEGDQSERQDCAIEQAKAKTNRH